MTAFYGAAYDGHSIQIAFEYMHLRSLALSFSLSLSLSLACVCVLGVEGLGLRGSRLRRALLECISYMCNLSQVHNGDPKASTVKSISYICSLSKSVTRPRDPKASTVNPIRQPPTQHPGAYRLTNMFGGSVKGSLLRLGRMCQHFDTRNPES